MFWRPGSDDLVYEAVQATNAPVPLVWSSKMVLMTKTNINDKVYLELPVPDIIIEED